MAQVNYYIIMNTWKVYKHTTPSGKVYIGITCKTLVQRWKNGKAYKGCPKFNSSIKKYGWDNIIHECLYDNLSETEAKSHEMALIVKYKKLGISLNLTDGGDGNRRSVSEKTKTKISTSLKKFYETHQGTFAGKHISDEAKAKIREKVTKYRHTDEAKAKIKEASIRSNAKRKGKPAPNESVEKMRKSIIEYFKTHKNSTAGSIWIHRDNIRKRINPNLLQQYIVDGWIKGYK